MSAEVVAGVVSKAAEKPIERVWDLVSSPFILLYNYKKNVDDLKNKVNALKEEKEKVERCVEDIESKGEEVCGSQTWLTETRGLIRDVDEELKTDRYNVKKHFCGMCSNPVSLYKLSKKATEKAESIDSQTKKAAKLNLQSGLALAPLQQAASTVPGFQDFPSRREVLDKIMSELQSARVNRIGLHGMPGAGKSMLVKEVQRKAEADKMFEKVVLVKVTEKPELKRIQDQIARGLGMYQLSTDLTSQQVTDRIEAKLRKVVEKGKVLFIMDDVWTKLDLKEIGISFPETDSTGEESFQWKVLFTSRDRNVFSDISPQQVFEIGKITPLEARDMFMKIVGLQAIPTELKSIAKQIIEQCRRLPLAIATVANALKGRELPEWRSALTELSSPSPHNFSSSVSESIYAAIEVSYNHLESKELKQVFLLSAMLGPNFSLESLLKYGIGLGLFPRAYTIEEAQAKLLTLINRLKAASLLIESSDGSVNSFDMHDITRDVAISIACKDHDGLLLKDSHEPKEWYDVEAMKCFKWILLQNSDVNELTRDEEFERPNLAFFGMLNKDRCCLEIPDYFFKGMPKVRVLHLCQMRLSPLPSSIRFLKSLHTLCLEQSELGERLSLIGELKSLEILSLSGSEFESLPEEIGQLTRLQSLDLSNCDKLNVIPPNVLGKLFKLEELYLANSFIQWEHEEHRGVDQERASLAELKNLKKLVVLEVCIGDIQMIPTGLLLENLKKYKIYIGKTAETNHVDDYFDSARMVKLQLNAPLSVDYSVKEQLFNNTEELYLEGLNHVQNVISELYDEGFQHLRYLSVKNAPDVHQIINTEEMFPLNAFPALEELFLHELISLEKVFHGSVREESLTKLTKITVGFCKQVQTLFSSSIALQLVQLQQIDVQHCDKMEAVVDDEERGRHDIIATGSPKFGEQLRSLRLQHLPQLIGFSRSCNSRSLFNDKVVISNLEEMMLSSIHVSTIWSTPSSSFVKKLVNLVIEGCDNLQYLFPLSMARGLENLRFLRIRGCKNMEKVIYTQNGDEEKEILIFPKLESLHISGLQRLVEFYEGNCAIQFPSLKLLNISNCQEMKRFVTNTTATDEDVFFTKKVEFSKLESMYLSSLKCLTKIWHYQHFKPSFCKLKSLVVSYCVNLGTIFPSIDMRETSLELIEIKGCNSVQVVFEIGDLNVGSTGHDQGRDIQLKEIIIEDLPELKHVWDKDPQGMLSFGNLETVWIFMCPKTRHVFPETIAKSLLQLQKLFLWRSGMEEIVAASRIGATSDSEQVVKFNFPQLSSLTLRELSKLYCFYPGKHLIVWPMLKEFDFVRTFVSATKKRETDDGLGKLDFPVDLPLFPLKQVIHRFRKISLSEGDTKMISRCHFKGDPFSNIKQLLIYNFISTSSAVFSIPFLQKCCSLEDLSVRNSHFEELFPSNVKTFSKIKKFELRQLPLLIHIWSQDSSHALPNLEDLRVRHCDCLISLSTSSKASFWINLTTLEVTYCKRMKNLVSPSTARNLTQLQTLTVAFCGALTEVVGNKEEEEEEDGARDSAIIFEKLRYLELKGLTRMTSFCSGNFNFEFPSLKQVIVEQCPHLKIFCEGNIKAPELHGVKVSKLEENLRWHYDLNKTIQAMYKDEVGYARLENLELSAFPQLIKIWHNGNPQEKLDFGRLERLMICNCNDLSYLLTTSMALSLVLLKKLVVENCGVIEQVIKGSNEAQDQVIIFQLLWEIELENCSILTSFYKGSDNGLKFPALYRLDTRDCPKMVTFADFTSSDDHEEAAPQAQCFFGNKVVLPELMILQLKDMPSISKIWEDDFDVPSGCAKLVPFGMLERRQQLSTTRHRLEELNLSEYPEGVPIRNQELQGILCFKMLTCLEVCNLPNLRYALTPSMALGLEQLKEFRVINCEAIEQVIADTGEGSQGMLFPKMEILILEDLPSLTSFGSGNSFEFPSLTQLILSKCPLLKAFISSSGISQDSIVSSGNVESTSSGPPLFDAKVAFPKLESLIFKFMESLNKIWDDQLDDNSFYQLDNINVSACNKLVYIFPLSMLGRLQTLNKMEIWNCKSLVEIFGSSQSQSHGMEIPPIKLVFPKLTSISLCGLPELKCFFPQIHTIECPSMTTLEVKRCHKIQILASEFQSAKEDNQFEISAKCSLLWVTKTTFSSLEELKVENNGLMEEIWHGHNQAMSFSKMEKLELQDLPKLTMFGSGNSLEFPSLKALKISKCPLLKTFISSSSNNISQDLTVSSGKEVDDTSCTPALFDAKVAFPRLEHLRIEFMGSLNKIWHDQLDANSFCQLDLICVKACDKLSSIFPLSMLGRLQTLNELEIWSCDSLEEIIHPHGRFGSQSVIETPIKLVFSKLTHLDLDMLPKLKCFFPRTHIIEFPSMTELEVIGCDQIQILASEFQSAMEDNQLEIVDKCSLFWVTKATFPVLKEVNLVWSGSMEEIWHGQDPEDYFPELQVVKLKYFPEQLVESQSFFFQSLPKLQKLVVDGEIKAFKDNAGKETGRRSGRRANK